MLARIRKAQEENEGGFTLIELLVVMIIIGILAAIAIPVFLNQRKSARDAAAKSDVRTVATSLESFYTNNSAYAAVTQGSAGALVKVGASGTNDQKVSQGDGITVTFNGTTGSAGSSTAFCIKADNVGSTQKWYHQSDNGGLQTITTADCAAYTLTTPA